MGQHCEISGCIHISCISKTFRCAAHLNVLLIQDICIHPDISQCWPCAIDDAKKSFFPTVQLYLWESRPFGFWTRNSGAVNTKCLPVLLYGLEVCSPTKAKIRSMDYAISSCYRKIFNVKLSNSFVWKCLTVMMLTRCWWSEGRSSLMVMNTWTIYCAK